MPDARALLPARVGGAAGHEVAPELRIYMYVRAYAELEVEGVC